MNHFQDFVSFFLVLCALVCILAMLNGFFLAIGMHIAEIFMSLFMSF